MLAADLRHEWWQERPTPVRPAPLTYRQRADLALLSSVIEHLWALGEEKSPAPTSSSAAAHCPVLVWDDAYEILLEADLFAALADNQAPTSALP